MSKIQNIDVRFNASSNFGKVKADLAALQAQAASLGAVFAQSAFARPPALVDPVSWQRSTRAVHEASNAYRNAVSSSGLLTSQQIRATAESERYTKSLQKQKLTLGEIRKHSGIMKEVYRDQLRYQRMTAQYWGTDSAGRAITDITIPKNVPRELDTVAQKMHFTGQMAKSAGTQIVNMGKNMQWAGRQLTVGFTYPVALFGAAAGVMAYKVDEAMTAVTKVYDVSAKAQENEALRVKELNEVRIRSYEVAEVAARKYGQSIEDTLGVEQALAATGLSGDKLFSSTEAVSRIATLGDLDLTASTDMTIALQTAFRDTIKTTDDLNNAFNYMNAVENATSLSIKDIAEATPRAASAMSALGVSVQEMTVLLTSMREAGVNAAEGANALKSATGTILSPSPAAIEFIKGIAGNKIATAMENLRESTGGNLYQAIRQIYELTENLSASDRQAVIVKMFGKYQFNRVSAMVSNLGAAFDGTQNQARKAMDLMGEDSQQLGDRAERELAEKMEAISGRFKAAWQAMRIELAKAGEPFLEVAIIAAEVAGNVLSFFNGMSDWKKKAALGVAAVLAIAGPIVMVGGLFMNLAGQFITGSGRIMSALGRMGGAMGLVTKEEKAATLSAEAQNRALAQQQTRTSTLASEVAVLTAAYEKATVAARAYAQSTGVPVAGAVRPATVGPHAAPIGPQLPPVTGPVAYSYARGATAAEKAASRDAAVRAMQVAEMKRIQAQEAINQKAAKEAALREKISGSISGAAIGTGVMAASMATMMLTTNETANNIAKWAMIGTIAVPAMQMLVGGGNALVGSIGKAVTAARTGAAGVTAMGTAMNVAKAGAVGFGTALNAALGPIGWIALGLTAVAGTFFAIKNHNDKIKEEQEALLNKQLEATKVMQASTASIATSLGEAAGSYKQITNAGGAAMGGTGSQSDVLRSYEYYKSEEGNAEVDALRYDGKLLETDALMDKVRGKFIDLQVLGNDTAEQAKTDIQAMLLAAGASAVDAASIAERVYQQYGDVSKIDWAGPIRDQAEALDDLARQAFQLSGNWVTSGGFATYVSEFQIDSGAKKQLYAQAEKSTEIFNQALSTAANPAEAKKIVDQYMQAATSQWQTGFESLMASAASGSDAIKELFRQYGIDSGEAFAAAMRDNGAFEEAYLDLSVSPNVNAQLQGQLMYVREFATEYEHAFIKPLAESSWYLSDSVLTAATALKQFAAAGIGLGPQDAAKSLMEQNAAYLEYAEIQRQIAVYENSNPTGGNTATRLALQNKLLESGNRLTKVVNELNQQYGFKQGRNATEALKFLMNEVADESGKAKDEVEGVNKALKSMPTRKNVTIKVSQVGGIIQTAMSNVQGRMADSAMNQFNAGWDAQMDAAQQSWENRSDNLQASHDAAMNRLERGQEAAQEAFDNRWERRREAIEKAYDKRIERVNREMEAEKRADEIRQRLFENEKRRLQALADAENSDIDFNTALNEGRLDDAAKTLNNAGVSSANAQMEAEQQAAEARTQARINALEKKNERLEKARDRELENLSKLEERMRKHLERVQDARRKALEKQQAEEVDALERSEEASMRSMEKQRNYEEAMLQQRLELFKSYTARNQKDLERWMREVGLSYDDFGEDVKAKGERWSTYFRKELATQIRQAGTEVMNDNIWENVGKGIANKLLKGLGFENLAAFNRFVRTGQRGAGSDAPETRHEGGVVGSGKGSRKGVPSTYKGLHRSETMIRAQKGEYVVNKNASSQHRDILDSINSGNYDRNGNRLPRSGGPFDEKAGIGDNGYGNMGGFTAGVISHLWRQGVSNAFNNAYQKGLAKEQAREQRMALRYSGIGGRQYNLGPVKPWVAEAAHYLGNKHNIGTIGGYRASATDMNGHPAGRALDFMTSSFAQGDALMRDIIKLQGPLDAEYAIWKQRITGGSRPWGTWSPMEDRGSATANHMDHVHLNFNASGDTGDLPGLGGVSGPGGAKGSGKYWRASDPGKGWTNSHDYRNGMRSPVYAIGPGVVRTAQLPASAGSGQHPNASPRGYGSYGVVSYLTTDDGHRVTYAHLYPGTQVNGRVAGGQRIALSASTGNSSGPHTHFELNGSTNAQGGFAALGIPLRTGGTIKYDNTPANLHRGETVLTAPLTQKFKDNVASGGGDQYTVTIDLRGAYIKEDVDIEKAVNVAIDKRENKVGRKRVVK